MFVEAWTCCAVRGKKSSVLRMPIASVSSYARLCHEVMGSSAIPFQFGTEVHEGPPTPKHH